ncbi:Phosphatidylcholine synthase [Legionella pneumophila subsp. pneumophila LPE509]|nr:Phosphatidylcholine synthase [Legionella pneumophila subsp. pneumophila LPE509]
MDSLLILELINVIRASVFFVKAKNKLPLKISSAMIKSGLFCSLRRCVFAFY